MCISQFVWWVMRPSILRSFVTLGLTQIQTSLEDLIKITIEMDIIILALPCIQNLCENHYFSLVDSIGDISKSIYFQRSIYKCLMSFMATILKCLITKINILYHNFVVGRNQLVHCLNKNDLEVRILGVHTCFNCIPKCRVMLRSFFLLLKCEILLQLTLDYVIVEEMKQCFF